MKMVTYTEEHLTRIITTYCFVTCLYIPATIIFLVYFDSLYEIGNFDSFPLLVGLTFAECLKFSATYSSNKTDKNAKKSSSFKNLVKFFTVLCGMTAVYYVIAVLFGAQIFAEKEQTFMFAALLSVLSTFPPCLNLGTDKTVGMFSDLTAYKGDVFSEFMLRNIRFTLVGAWFGAFVIPLDWDRPWQVWPIPCSLGSMIGYVLSHFYTLCVIVAKRTSKFGKKTGKYGL